MGFQVNLPIPTSLASECRKAARILNSFTDDGRGVDVIIPPNILGDAKGLAIFTVLKAGFLFSGRAGSGIVVAKLPDGSWSAPSAIMTGGMGVGGQVGAELTDFIMVLNTRDAVRTFMHHGSITLGGNVSVAAGPIGRNAEASGTASLKTVSAVYSYSKTRGLFAGVSLEGSVILERFDANKKLYGHKVQTRDLLNGTIPQPPAADPLYRALETKSYKAGGRFGHMDYDRDGYFDDRNRDHYHDDPYTRYDNTPNSQSFSRDDTPNRYNSPSFSRGDIHQMAKTGSGRPRGNTFSSSANDYDSPTSRPRGNTFSHSNSNWRDDYDNAPRQIAHSPKQLSSRDLVVSNPNERRARALYNFRGEQQGDLPFHKGDIITIVQKTDTQNDWWTGKLDGKQGIFPANFIELL